MVKQCPGFEPKTMMSVEWGDPSGYRDHITVEPPITDPPISGQPLYNGHWLWHQMKSLQN